MDWMKLNIDKLIGKEGDDNERHFQQWLDRTIPFRDENERAEVESSIKKLLSDHPDLIDKNYSWPEMRRMSEHESLIDEANFQNERYRLEIY